MNTHDLITKYKFTPKEKIIFEWQFRMMGDFEAALMKAIILADDMNMVKLRFCYPTHVDALLGWREGALWQELTVKMDAHPEIFARFRL